MSTKPRLFLVKVNESEWVTLFPCHLVCYFVSYSVCLCYIQLLSVVRPFKCLYTVVFFISFYSHLSTMKIDSLWSFANFDVIKKFLWFIQAYFFCRETYIYFICIFLMLYKILYYSLFFIYTYSEHNKNCKNFRDNIKNTKKT